MASRKIDKTWMEISDRSLPEYIKGVSDFLDFALSGKVEKVCRCPCKKCKNNLFFNEKTIYEHLIFNGITKYYKIWFHHGEKLYESDEENDKEVHDQCNVGVQEMVYDFGQANANFSQMFDCPLAEDECNRHNGSKIREETNKYYRLLEEFDIMVHLPMMFDIMVHLPIHLATEAKLAGPVQFRWMYPIERFLRRLKSYVKNKARPEGSIAEAYIVQECVEFCSRYRCT